MYNRYVPNAHGTYERIPQPSTPAEDAGPRVNSSAGAGNIRGQSGASPDGLRSLLSHLRLDTLDTGDLLLLAILFLLFKDGEDQELLIALGLLLIL